VALLSEQWLMIKLANVVADELGVERDTDLDSLIIEWRHILPSATQGTLDVFDLKADGSLVTADAK